MSLMEWSSALDVGVEAMNNEHKQILDLMNRIASAAESGQTGSAVTQLVDQLATVTIAHFSDEEAYMASIGYTGLATHKLIHADLLTKYTAYAGQIHRDGGRLPDKFLTFLKLWLTAHIRGIDMKYGPASQGLKQAG